MLRYLRFYYTVRELRVKQVFYRIYYRFARIRKIKFSNVKRDPDFKLDSSPQWAEVKYTQDGSFNFMGIKSPLSWESDDLPRIWLYNLHYLDGIDCFSSRELSRNLIDEWISGNPPYTGCGWEPYPTSLRIVNLIKFFSATTELKKEWLDSLACQVCALSQQVEHHILANHLFVNGKALLMAGCFLSGDDAERWKKQGLKILDREIAEQFLPDGAHFELSPMYHASLIWDMCDLVNLVKHSQDGSLNARLEAWKQVVGRGVSWLRGMQHPDGDIPFFNDASFGISPKFVDIERYARSLGCVFDANPRNSEGILANCYDESGFAAVDLDSNGKLLINFAQITPSYQPGHAHADTLSFELSVFGQRIFVNSGTSQYGLGDERNRQRGTAAHNTVEVDGENSSEVWSGFRVARRATVTFEKIENSEDFVKICCSHDGYMRLKGRNRHRREWRASRGSIQVLDEVTGTFEHAVSRLFLHPSVEVSGEGSQFCLKLLCGKIINLSFQGASSVDVVDSTWHPGFGKVVKSQCVVVEFSSGSLITSIGW